MLEVEEVWSPWLTVIRPLASLPSEAECESLFRLGRKILDSGRSGIVVNLRGVPSFSEDLAATFLYLSAYARERNARVLFCEANLRWSEMLGHVAMIQFPTEQEAVRACRDR